MISPRLYFVTKLHQINVHFIGKHEIYGLLMQTCVHMSIKII